MQPISPVMPGSEAIEVVLAKDQPEYLPLPAVYIEEPGRFVTRWRLSDEERQKVVEGGDVILTQLTFGNPFHPVNLQVCHPHEQPDLLEGGERDANLPQTQPDQEA
jgi:hypothetical protein